MYVHPELAAILEQLPPRPENPYADINALRAEFREVMASVGDLADPRVAVTETSVPGPDANSIPTRVLRPRAGTGTLPAVVYYHGGGYAFGELDGPDPSALVACATAEAVVISPHYRLAPEHGFPAGIEDCYAVLTWVHEHAPELGIDRQRIAVLGASAGGEISAAVCLMSRDRDGPPIAMQCLLIPMLDDRGDSQSMRAITDRRFVNGPEMRHAWDTYLGADRDPATTSPYAAPARASDLHGLPRAYIQTGGLDPLRDEALDYAARLARADVPVDSHHTPGAWHFFQAYAPHSTLTQQTTALWLQQLRDALAQAAGGARAAIRRRLTRRGAQGALDR